MTSRSLPIADLAAIATEALAARDERRQIAPFSSRYDGLDLDTAYRIAADVRAQRIARGETPVGRKIGFTNRTIWAEYDVWAPIWGSMYQTTVHDLAALAGRFSLDGLAEPRIEPEIVFGLARAPEPGMDAAALLGCIEWVAHGFEIVQSIFPGWKFAAADCVAAFGLHGALLVGPRQSVSAHRAGWLASLSSFAIDLACDGVVVDHGQAANVLDGPLFALRHLVELLAADPSQPALAAGEVVTTGTLTRALPVAPGQVWTTALRGVALAGIGVRFG
ncbi:hydratase [Aquincola sp. S2]|uniref:Hydratase n=1 Tax=Pseudaquabacterium terrae TaxID=2732868 RepID=A0ABX2EE86_9BURK|nr:hydratase [Aquabacterium terrae]NRF66940.1 hydratase [Aquabacterium terrae]